MESSVVTLATSRRLKKFGFPQGSYWAWTQDMQALRAPFLQTWERRSDGELQGTPIITTYVLATAPNAQEIADQLPKQIRFSKDDRNDSLLTIYFQSGKVHAGYEEQIDYEGGRLHIIETGDNLAEALAALWLKIKEPS